MTRCTQTVRNKHVQNGKVGEALPRSRLACPLGRPGYRNLDQPKFRVLDLRLSWRFMNSYK